MQQSAPIVGAIVEEIMILFLMQAAAKNLLFGFLSEPLGVLIFAVALVGGAVGLRWFFRWNEEMAAKARNLSQELLEKTVG